MIQEFKKFISRGNVVDLAVGMMIGSAFTAIVGSLVNDILMPLIGMLTGGLDLSGLAVTIGSASLAYGAFLQAIINFLCVALCLFFMVKAINKASKKKEEEPKPEPKKSPESELLEEIRDLLKEKK